MNIKTLAAFAGKGLFSIITTQQANTATQQLASFHFFSFLFSLYFLSVFGYSTQSLKLFKMQFSIALIAALTSGVFAAPAANRDSGKDTSVSVVLIRDGMGISSPVTKLQGAEEGRVEAQPSGGKGPFKSVNILLGKDVQNKDLRCSVFDDNDEEIVGTRGKNIDITFSDGGNGKWDFRAETNVTSIVCDPAFKKITPEELEAGKLTTVKLINEGTESTTPISGFTGLKREEKPFNSEELWREINIEVGKFAENQALRCQIEDHRGVAIEAKRGKNIDTTFSDAGKGRWTFLMPEQSVVSKVICDPAFKSANPA